MNDREKMQWMLDEQEAYQTALDPDWRDSPDMEFWRAIWLKCADLVEHLDWQWWGGEKTVNWLQAKLELVDIWHFALADALLNVGRSVLFDYVRVVVPEPRPQARRVLSAAEYMARKCLDEGAIQQRGFTFLLEAMGMGFDELFRLYVAKKPFNDFRQKHGHGQDVKKYNAVWGAKEDAEHLMEILEALPAPDAPQDIRKAVEDGMEERWRQAKTHSRNTKMAKLWNRGGQSLPDG